MCVNHVVTLEALINGLDNAIETGREIIFEENQRIKDFQTTKNILVKSLTLAREKFAYEQEESWPYAE